MNHFALFFSFLMVTSLGCAANPANPASAKSDISAAAASVLLPELPAAAPGHEAVLFAFDNHAFPFRELVELQLFAGGRPRIVLLPGSEGSHDEQILYYGTVIKLGDVFHMWYNGNSGPLVRPEGGGERVHWRLCLATSRDGVNWEKPNLGLVEFNGSKQNNIVALDAPDLWSSGAVLHDPEDPDPRRRFKLVYENQPRDAARAAAMKARFGSNYPHTWSVAFSPDGLRWTNSLKNPVGGFFEMAGITRHRGLYYINGQAPAGGSRALVTFASADFEHWSPVPAPGLWRPEQVHLGAALWNRGNVIVVVYWMWHEHASGDRQLTVMDLGLALSYDAIHFHEPIPGFRLVPAREQPGKVIGLFPALMQGQGMENHGDETLYWYSAWRGYEGRGVRLVTWGRDRLGSLKTGSRKGGRVISTPIRILAGRPAVAINASGLGQYSQIRVGLLDEGFRPVAGYSGSAAAIINESGFKIPVPWAGGSTLPSGIGVVRLDLSFEGIRPEDCQLHAIYVGG